MADPGSIPGGSTDDNNKEATCGSSRRLALRLSTYETARLSDTSARRGGRATDRNPAGINARDSAGSQPASGTTPAVDNRFAMGASGNEAGG